MRCRFMIVPFRCINFGFEKIVAQSIFIFYVILVSVPYLSNMRHMWTHFETVQLWKALPSFARGILMTALGAMTLQKWEI